MGRSSGEAFFGDLSRGDYTEIKDWPAELMARNAADLDAIYAYCLSNPQEGDDPRRGIGRESYGIGFSLDVRDVNHGNGTYKGRVRVLTLNLPVGAAFPIPGYEDNPGVGHVTFRIWGEANRSWIFLNARYYDVEQDFEDVLISPADIHTAELFFGLMQSMADSMNWICGVFTGQGIDMVRPEE